MNDLQSTLDTVISSLKEGLGKNLFSCCLYGSVVRGGCVEGVSDINLLIVLDEFNLDTQAEVRKALKSCESVDPFVLGRRGFERSVRAFAPKFLSIQRNYRVLYGEDPLKEIKVDEKLERFLCEQAMRNLRLRLAHAFITRSKNRSYSMFLARSVTPFFLRLSEMLRLDGVELPNEIAARIPVLAKASGMDEQTLSDLLAYKEKPATLSEDEAAIWHAKIFKAVDTAVRWMEFKWPA